jgi:hypothetical protein
MGGGVPVIWHHSRSIRIQNQVKGHSCTNQAKKGKGENVQTVPHGGFHAKEAKEARNDRTWTKWHDGLCDPAQPNLGFEAQ